MRAKRRVHLLLPLELEQDLRAVGREQGIGLAPAIRLMVRRGLEGGPGHGPCRECNAAVAGLIAAEHALLVVASILPGGESLIRGLAAEASAAAERRLALIEQPDSHDEALR